MHLTTFSKPSHLLIEGNFIMADGLGSGLLEIAMAIIGIALIALLVGNSQKTVQVLSQAGNTFNDLLATVTLQSGSRVGTSTGFVY